MRGPNRLLTFSDYALLTVSAFVSLTAAYVVFVTDPKIQKRLAARILLTQARLRTWFSIFAVAFLTLFLDQFVRVLPKTPFSESVARAAAFVFYALMAFVVVDALRIVTGAKRVAGEADDGPVLKAFIPPRDAPQQDE